MTKLIKRMVLNLQQFAEGDPNPNPAPTPAPTPTPTPTPAGKTFSEDYVVTLREEAKSLRLGAKANETNLRTLLGIKDGDITAEHVAAFQTSQTKLVSDAMSKANDRLITAEVKGLADYDHSLVARLLDRSKVTIADDGTITGLKEAVEALAIEFPSIKKQPTGGSGSNPAGGAGSDTPIQALEKELVEAVTAKNMAWRLAVQDKIFQLQKK